MFRSALQPRKWQPTGTS